MAGGGQGVGATWGQFQSEVMSSGNRMVMVAHGDTLNATELALKMVMMVKSTLRAFYHNFKKGQFLWPPHMEDKDTLRGRQSLKTPSPHPRGGEPRGLGRARRVTQHWGGGPSPGSTTPPPPSSSRRPPRGGRPPTGPPLLYTQERGRQQVGEAGGAAPGRPQQGGAVGNPPRSALRVKCTRTLGNRQLDVILWNNNARGRGGTH